jgi:hypothetical protein
MIKINNSKAIFRIDMDILRDVKFKDKEFKISFYMDILDLSKYPPPLRIADCYEIIFDNEIHMYVDRYLELEDRTKIINYAYKLLNNHKKKKWDKFPLRTVEGEIMYEKIFHFRKDTVYLEQFVFPRSSNAKYILEFNLNKKTVLEIRFKDNRNLDNFRDIVEKIEFVFNNYNDIDRIIEGIVKDVVSSNKVKIKRLYDKIIENFDLDI